jgi:hypothetical protein
MPAAILRSVLPLAAIFNFFRFVECLAKLRDETGW